MLRNPPTHPPTHPTPPPPISASPGSAPPARLTLLAVGRQLSFARALLALDEQGKPLDLDPARR